MTSPRLLVLLVPLSLLAGCRLTPDDVRELIKHPTGEVNKASMDRVASGLVLSDVATTAEKAALTFKNVLAGDPEKIDVQDVFCVGSLVADTADFAACTPGNDCEAELVIDACLLRLGEADDNASGKIRFKLKNTSKKSQDTTEASIQFEDFQATRDGGTTTDLFQGLVALETNVLHDDKELAAEAVFTSDVETSIRTIKRTWLFDDGILRHRHAIAGIRATTKVGEEDAKGTVEIVAFVDEDGGRDEAVVIRVKGDSHKVDADKVASTVDVEVEGSNGKFTCNFDELDTRANHEGVHVRTSGGCKDPDGKDFSFSGEVLEQ